MSMGRETQLNLNQTATEYNHLDSTENEKDTAAFIFLMVFGAVFAVQIFVLIVFGTMRAWDAVFGSQARTTDQPEPQTEYQFPFLPSYLMAISETRMNQQTTGTLTENTYLLYHSVV